MAFGIKSFGQSWILNNDVDSISVSVTLYDDDTYDPGFTDDSVSDLNAPSNINDASITLDYSTSSGVYEFSKTNISVDVSNVTSTNYVDAYAIHNGTNVILTGGINDGARVNLKDVDTFEIDEVGGSFL